LSTITDVYEELLDGRRKKFPDGTWNHREEAIRVIKYLIEEKLKWSREDVCKYLSVDVFTKYKLRGLLNKCFNDSPYKALEATYPGVYKGWELQNAPIGFWNKENAVQAMKWLIEEKLKWSREEVCSRFNIKVLNENGLGSMVVICYSNSPFEALDAAYPGVYNPWELKSTPSRYWTRETGIRATRWLLEEQLEWTRKDICKGLTRGVFKQNGLVGMLERCFNGSPYKALEAAYPGIYKPWELRWTPNGYWTPTTGVEATKWLIEEKLGLTMEEAYNSLTITDFIQNGLNSMLHRYFKNNIHRAIQAVYS